MFYLAEIAQLQQILKTLPKKLFLYHLLKLILYLRSVEFNLNVFHVWMCWRKSSN